MSGTPTGNITPLQGAVLASPVADNTLKIPGSTSDPRQMAAAPLLHAGVTNRVVRPTLSVSFGVVDVLMIRTLAEKISPTVADPGHVGVALPPIPACAGATPSSTNASSAAPARTP